MLYRLTINLNSGFLGQRRGQARRPENYLVKYKKRDNQEYYSKRLTERIKCSITMEGKGKNGSYKRI